nr:RING/U-box superfamily protein [Tanacetum cinerariifolium]
MVSDMTSDGDCRARIAILTCMVSLGGAIVGTIMGAIKGQPTETRLVRGAITALQLMDMIIDGDPFSKAWKVYTGSYI